MGEDLNVLLGLWKPALALMTPSLLVGLLIMWGAYKLINKWGDRFLDAQDRQASAFEKIASSVDAMKIDVDSTAKFSQDIRITMAAMAQKLDHIYERVHCTQEEHESDE